MCGIVGYVGPREVRDLLLEGLRKLEYRGYDSAGIAVLREDGIDSVRAVGPLAALDEALAAVDAAAPAPRRASGAARHPVATIAADPQTGIGHTRWATHGRVSEANAHPHADMGDRVH